MVLARTPLLLGASLVLSMAQTAVSQADGNPHHWDRRRRCDHTDYSPACGACEGYGGIPTGDDNSAITLTSCEIVANASSVDPSTLVKPDWGVTWTAQVHEVLIGKKTDPFCFQTFPSNDSTGPLCYRPDYGQQVYDMKTARGLREDLTVESTVGHIKSTVLHQGPNFWIINQFPWYTLGTHQCICTQARQGGDHTQPAVYPVQYNWTQQTFFIGREKIGVEYMTDPALKVQTLDHWAFGPHHIWSSPEDGRIVRMWQPFNGLQIFLNPTSAHTGPVNQTLFKDIPPALCKKGGATFRIKCDDNGMPVVKGDDNEEEEEEEGSAKANEADMLRATQVVPRRHLRGDDFADMSSKLNAVLAAGANGTVATKDCSEWSAKELQLLQQVLYELRDAKFDDVYQQAGDNRRIRDSLDDLRARWMMINSAVEGHPDETRLAEIQRDGHCHEAVMWYVHHMTSDLKEIMSMNGFELPLLSTHHHGAHCDSAADNATAAVCDLYQEQVTCFSCHSNSLPPGGSKSLAGVGGKVRIL